MAAVPPKFQVEEEVSLAGRMLRIAGLVQYDMGDDNVVTRYSLVDPTGAAVILQQEGGNFSMLRPFPPAAAPTAEGSSVSVMGEKYNLAGVRKMKMLGASGKPPAESPQAPLTLSGVFEGKMGRLLREMVPGAKAQSYFLVKPVQKDELLSGQELAHKQDQDRVAAQAMAQVQEVEDAEEEEKPFAKFASWAVSLAVIFALAWACSGDDDDSSSSSGGHSVRIGSGSHSHGGGK
jgi:hypothetical protein